VCWFVVVWLLQLRLKRIEEAGELGKEVKSLAQTMPKYTVKNRKEVSVPKPHTVYNIFHGSNFVCAKRYSEFASHHAKMVKRFRWFTFPTFPPKKLNGFFSGAMALTESEKDARREKLNEYLVLVMAVEDIATSSLMTGFLGPVTSRRCGISFRLVFPVSLCYQIVRWPWPWPWVRSCTATGLAGQIEAHVAGAFRPDCGVGSLVGGLVSFY
jgi:hypothetical protein